MNQAGDKKWILIGLAAILIIPAGIKIWREFLPPPPPAREAAALEGKPPAVVFEEFTLSANEERQTALIEPGKYYNIWANQPLVVLSKQPDGTIKEYSVSAGWSGWEGIKPKGLLRVKALSANTILQIHKVK